MSKDCSRRGMNVFNADGEEEERTSAGEDSINKEFLLGCCRVKQVASCTGDAQRISSIQSIALSSAQPFDNPRSSKLYNVTGVGLSGLQNLRIRCSQNNPLYPKAAEKLLGRL